MVLKAESIWAVSETVEALRHPILMPSYSLLWPEFPWDKLLKHDPPFLRTHTIELPVYTCNCLLTNVKALLCKLSSTEEFILNSCDPRAPWSPYHYSALPSSHSQTSGALLLHTSPPETHISGQSSLSLSLSYTVNYTRFCQFYMH